MRNNILLCKEPFDYLTVMHTKLSAIVMDFGFMSNKCHVVSPNIFPQSFNVNFATYNHVLEKYVESVSVMESLNVITRVLTVT